MFLLTITQSSLVAAEQDVELQVHDKERGTDPAAERAVHDVVRNV